MEPAPHLLTDPARPDSNGQVRARTTEQRDLMVLLVENLDLLLPDAFVAADLSWYPAEARPEIRCTPDVMVALGRPKGPRRSYRTGDEAGVAPQVVFETWSSVDTFPEKMRKLRLYQRYGVRELYVFDIDREQFSAWAAVDGALEPLAAASGVTSPLLGVRMEPIGRSLRVYAPNGEPFLTTAERQQRLDAARAEAAAAQAQVEAAKAQVEAARVQADAERAAHESLLAKLRAAGIDPGTL